MTYLYPSGKEIAEHRQAGIRAGVKVYAKGHCHFCGYSVGKGALWCCAPCAGDYACEVAKLIPALELIGGELPSAVATD